MRHALGLGARGLGHVWPNPAVGCVIVNAGRIVGRGWTAPGGRPHAETVALLQAGKRARGASVYVTLEPCAHQGQTPPCADGLIAAGVARVVVACGDPDPRVNGAGTARLRAAGVEVVEGVCAQEAAAAHAGFFLRVREGRPFVTLKLASSLDGRIATASGESKWITGPLARRAVHAMRAGHDAVMVGGGTARSDDPSLTVRDLGVTHQPVRIVWVRHLDLPLQGQLAKTAGETPVWILHGEDADAGRVRSWRDTGATLLACALGDGQQLDPVAALQILGSAGLTRVFCEGGGALAASLLRAGVVDALVTFTAGIGIGAEGQAMLGAMRLDRLADAPRFEQVDCRALGADIMGRWRKVSG
ncbi:MAG: bifunctional diaminohydroxyphosphoribosylaminopyrimidine deaminase/5-amino-6-(5-phosphoribosylamino)uracil reductase RibD [Paracoccaceae bacterium]